MARRRALNVREETFARRVAVERKSLREAYATSYNVSNPTAEWVRLEGYRVAARPNVSQRITELMEEAAQAAGATREWAMASLKETADRGMQAKPVLDHEGNATGEWQHDGRVVTAAIRLIADMCGWIPKGGKGDDADAARSAILARLAELDPEALRAMAAMPVDALPGPTDEAGEPSA